MMGRPRADRYKGSDMGPAPINDQKEMGNWGYNHYTPITPINSLINGVITPINSLING